jgi:hypothetical protein
MSDQTVNNSQMEEKPVVLLSGEKMPEGYESCGYKNCLVDMCKGACMFPVRKFVSCLDNCDCRRICKANNPHIYPSGAKPIDSQPLVHKEETQEEWISVKTPPDTGRTVLCYGFGDRYFTAIYNKERNVFEAYDALHECAEDCEWLVFGRK